MIALIRRRMWASIAPNPLIASEITASIMRDVQREQCGRSMRVSDGPEGK